MLIPPHGVTSPSVVVVSLLAARSEGDPRPRLEEPPPEVHPARPARACRESDGELSSAVRRTKPEPDEVRVRLAAVARVVLVAGPNGDGGVLA